MQAAPGHDVGFAPKDSSGCVFHVHQLEKPERAFRMVKEEIDIGVFTCLASRRRAEQVEMLDAEPLQLGFVLLELGDRFAAFHRSSLILSIAQTVPPLNAGPRDGKVSGTPKSIGASANDRRSACSAANMARKVPAAAANDPDTARFAVWYDVLGLDSEYDYDPVWANVSRSASRHIASSNQGLRLSPTNFTYNHIGHFAAAGHATPKSGIVNRTGTIAHLPHAMSLLRLTHNSTVMRQSVVMRLSIPNAERSRWALQNTRRSDAAGILAMTPIYQSLGTKEEKRA